jgi:hypothetical protein
MVVDIGEMKRHIKPKADSTLHNMRKNDLIEYIRCLEHNYNVAVSFNENQAKYVESLGLSIGWIPVTERLPEDMNDRVLVLLKNSYHYPIGDKRMDTDRYRGEYRKWVRYGDLVTHWMPLPEPPEEN